MRNEWLLDAGSIPAGSTIRGLRWFNSNGAGEKAKRLTTDLRDGFQTSSDGVDLVSTGVLKWTRLLGQAEPAGSSGNTKQRN
ncbi:MAG: hypothetical protein ACN6OP_07905 [Pseudomonadales bacterium]